MKKAQIDVVDTSSRPLLKMLGSRIIDAAEKPHLISTSLE
jgi:hypothetical protein